MSFIEIDRRVADLGYESYLAVSDDLLHWEVLFPILRRSDLPVWDAKQCAAYTGFVNNDPNGDFAIRQVNGHYCFSYLGGNPDGYETDPLQMGECRVENLLDPASYTRYRDRAVLAVPGATITGDLRILRDGDRYIMLYFVLMGNRA